MFYATLNEAENAVVQSGTLQELFPQSSFPKSGPSAEWMAENRTYPVQMSVSYDPASERLVVVSPFIAGPGDVRAVQVEQLSLNDLKQAKRAELRQRFTLERDKGVTVNGDLIATTHQARLELAALVENLTVSGGTQKGVTRSGKRIIFDLSTATAALAAVDAHHATCNATEYDLDAEIDAATTKEELEAIDLSVGWPE